MGQGYGQGYDPVDELEEIQRLEKLEKLTGLPMYTSIPGKIMSNVLKNDNKIKSGRKGGKMYAAMARNGIVQWSRKKIPTVCPRCGEMQPSAGEAKGHCRKKRTKKTARMGKGGLHWRDKRSLKFDV